MSLEKYQGLDTIKTNDLAWYWLFTDTPNW
jgi:hypothetical protein